MVKWKLPNDYSGDYVKYTLNYIYIWYLFFSSLSIRVSSNNHFFLIFCKQNFYNNPIVGLLDWQWGGGAHKQSGNCGSMVKKWWYREDKGTIVCSVHGAWTSFAIAKKGEWQWRRFTWSVNQIGATQWTRQFKPNQSKWFRFIWLTD